MYSITTLRNVEWGVESLFGHSWHQKTTLAMHIYAMSSISALLFSIVISLFLLVQFYAH